MKIGWYQWRTKKRQVWRRLLLFCALLVAALGTLAQPKSTWEQLRAAFRAFVSYAEGGQDASHWLYYGRMRQCFRYPLFYKPLRTCGTPLKKSLRDVGCHCSMPFKASMIYGSCWIRTDAPTSPHGWPANLCRFDEVARED